MIIGTDVSLKVCKEEGYLMAEYDGRRKFDPNRYYRVFGYLPNYIAKEIGARENTIHIDIEITFNELVEIYERHEIGINKCCDTNQHVNFEKPTYFDFLNLASDINAYIGLQ